MPPTRECALCPSTDVKACSRCREAFYCSTDHAKLLWPVHKKYCGKDVDLWYEEELTKDEVDALHALRDHYCKGCGVDATAYRKAMYKHLPGWPESVWVFPEASPPSSTPRLQSWVRSTGRQLLFDIIEAHRSAGISHTLPIFNSPIPQHIHELAVSVRAATFHPTSSKTPLGEQLSRRFLLQVLNFDHLTRWVEKSGPFEDLSFEGLHHVKVALDRLRAMEAEAKKVLGLTDQRGMKMVVLRAQNAVLDMTKKVGLS